MNLIYTADPQKAARVAFGSSTVTKTGPYVGRIKRAYVSKTSKGAQMFNVDFETDDGRKARTHVCITKKDGTASFGEEVVHALMVVLGVGRMQAVQRRITMQNGESMEVPFFTDLINKRVGLFLQRENYEGKDKEERFNMTLITPFDAKTQQCAKEIIENLPANRIAELTQTMKDKPAKPAQSAASAPSQSAALVSSEPASGPAWTTQDDTMMQDDIPF
jgi:hypothetical protein